MTIYGYEVTRNQNGQHKHIDMRLYVKGETYQGKTRWDRFASFSWQNNKDSDSWYGLSFDYTGSYSEDFDNFVKFINKFHKAELYRTEPEEMIDWLQSLRGSQRLVSDKRLGYDHLVTIDEFHNTFDLYAYKVIYNGQWYTTILATGEHDAKRQVIELWKDQPDKLEKWFNSGSPLEEKFDNMAMPLTFDELLKIEW